MFDDRVVEFMLGQEEQQTNCSEFTFGVSAVSTDSQELSTTYITGGYASGRLQTIAMCIHHLTLPL